MLPKQCPKRNKFFSESLHISGSDYKGVRTFAEQVKHVAASNYLIWSGITGDKAPDTANDRKGPEVAKAEILRSLKGIDQTVRDLSERIPNQNLR